MELMVAVGILAIVIAGLLGSFTTQHRTYVVVDQTTEAQQSVRTVADLMERDLRLAGFLVPEAAAACGWDATNGPDTLFISNTDVLRTVDALPDTDPNRLVPLQNGNLGALVQGIAPGGAVPPGAGTINLDFNYVDVPADGPDFAVNGGVIVMDRNDANARVACGIITNIDITGTTLTVNWNGTGFNASGSPDVIAVPAHVYSVTVPGGGLPNQLQRDGLGLAQDIEDFQLAFFFDADDDRNVDPDEMFGDGVDAAGGVDSSVYDPANTDGTTLREVRINLVGVTRDPDPRQEYVQGMPQALENRLLGVPPADRFRRRVHTATVRIRNVGNES